jgi:hypothetical protein
VWPSWTMFPNLFDHLIKTLVIANPTQIWTNMVIEKKNFLYFFYVRMDKLLFLSRKLARCMYLLSLLQHNRNMIIAKRTLSKKSVHTWNLRKKMHVIQLPCSFCCKCYARTTFGKSTNWSPAPDGRLGLVFSTAIR